MVVALALDRNVLLGGRGSGHVKKNGIGIGTSGPAGSRAYTCTDSYAESRSVVGVRSDRVKG